MPDGDKQIDTKTRYSAGVLSIKKWVIGNLTMTQKRLILSHFSELLPKME